MNEHIQFIPNFTTYRIWNATNRCWYSKIYTIRGHALNSITAYVKSLNLILILVVSKSEQETQYELI